MVINYELPRDPEVYVHRIGRTGRAGESGLAMSLVADAEVPRMLAIEKYQKNRAAVMYRLRWMQMTVMLLKRLW